MNVLVVDDEPIIRRLFMRVLSKEGHTFKGAKNALELESLFKPGFFQIAFIDVDLKSQPDGIALALKLKTEDPKIKIQMISGDKKNQDLVEKAGLGQIQLKPFGVEQIKKVLSPT